MRGISVLLGRHEWQIDKLIERKENWRKKKMPISAEEHRGDLFRERYQHRFNRFKGAIYKVRLKRMNRINKRR